MFELSATKLRTFKACPKKYYFAYVEKLRPVKTSDAFVMGSDYHANLASLLTTGKVPPVTDMASAMCEAFDKFVPWRDWGVTETETPYSVKLAPGIVLHGFIDAVCADGTPIEHKSSQDKPNEKYRARLFLDDQVSCYLLALTELTGKPVNRIRYTVCAKPNRLAPSKKLENNPEAQTAELLERQRKWFDSEKVAAFDVVRSNKEIADFKYELIYIARSIRSRKVFYRNPSACAMTGCEFSSICRDYDPQFIDTLTDYERKEEQKSESFKW